MGKNARIEHKGVISEIRDNMILVDLSVQSACAACHAKGVCGGDSEQRTIEIKTDKKSFDIGEIVNVIMKESLGMKALFLGYLLPFAVVVAALFVFLGVGLPEGVSGLLALASMLPYYIGLYLFRDRIKREFNFDIEKI